MLQGMHLEKVMVLLSGTKKEPKPKLLSPDIFWWGRGLPREGVGAKKFDTSLETQGIKLLAGKTRQSTVQEITGVQSWISPPPLTAPKHYKTSILGAVIVSERGFLEPPFFPERRVVGLLSFAQLQGMHLEKVMVLLNRSRSMLLLPDLQSLC